MPPTRTPGDSRREAQAAYRDARAQRAAPARERSTERERSRRSLSPATSDMDREAEEIGHLLAAKTKPTATKYYNWKGEELDVKITEKAVTFEGKRYTGCKMNTAFDLIIARGKKPSAKKKVDPYENWFLTDAEAGALAKKKAAAAKSSVKSKAKREETAKRVAEEDREREKKNKGGLMSWMGKNK